VPILVTLPSGLIHLPLVVLVTGKPGATVSATFALGGASVSRQRVTLDRRGYAQVRYAPLTTDTKPRGGRLTVVVSGALNSQTFSTGFTVLPGRGPARSRPALLARSPSLGLRVRVTLPVPIARRGQTITARISTAPLAPVQVAVYVGHQRIASGSGNLLLQAHTVRLPTQKRLQEATCADGGVQGDRAVRRPHGQRRDNAADTLLRPRHGGSELIGAGAPHHVYWPCFDGGAPSPVPWALRCCSNAATAPRPIWWASAPLGYSRDSVPDRGRSVARGRAA